MSYFKKLWKIFSLMVLELNFYVSHLQRLGKLLGLYMEPQRKTGTTLPETKIAPQKRWHPKRKFVVPNQVSGGVQLGFICIFVEFLKSKFLFTYSKV